MKTNLQKVADELVSKLGIFKKKNPIQVLPRCPDVLPAAIKCVTGYLSKLFSDEIKEIYQ